MSKRTAKGIYLPKNPEKLLKRGDITYRSGWEWQVMAYLDQHPWVIGWASEPVSISYQNPLTQKWSFYWPDFIVSFGQPNNGRRWAEMWEVKPKKEDPRFEGRVDRHSRAAQAVNAAKWKAAAIYCSKNRLKFRVLTELELFGYKK